VNFEHIKRHYYESHRSINPSGIVPVGPAIDFTSPHAFAVLQDASVSAADMLKTSCQADDALTPPARLAAVGKRLDTMLQAVKLSMSGRFGAAQPC
jgi:hypothetical protein